MKEKPRGRLVAFVCLLLYTIWVYGFLVFSEWETIRSRPDAYTEGGDSPIFVALATSLVERSKYNLAPGEPSHMMFPPGFPVYLSLLMRGFGDNWLFAFMALQALFSTLTVAVVFYWVSDMRDWRSGLLAAFLIASYAPLHFVCSIVYRETISIFLFVVIMAALYNRWYRPWTWLLLGVATGLAISFREEMLLLLPACVMGIWHGDNGFGCRHWKRTLPKLVGFAALIGVILFPWGLHNLRNLGRFQVMTDNGGIHLYLGNNPTWKWGCGVDYGIYSRIPELKHMSHHEVNQLYKERAIAYIIQHPVNTIVAMLYKLKLLLTPSVNNFNDLPFLLTGLVLGCLVAGVIRQTAIVTSATILAATFLFYVVGRGALNTALLLPNIEFGPLLLTLGLGGMGLAVWKRQQPLYVLCYLMLFSVNLVFVPQHRHRWLIDVLLMIWASLLLQDFLNWSVPMLRQRIQKAT